MYGDGELDACELIDHALRVERALRRLAFWARVDAVEERRRHARFRAGARLVDGHIDARGGDIAEDDGEVAVPSVTIDRERVHRMHHRRVRRARRLDRRAAHLDPAARAEQLEHARVGASGAGSDVGNDCSDAPQRNRGGAHHHRSRNLPARAHAHRGRRVSGQAQTRSIDEPERSSACAVHRDCAVVQTVHEYRQPSQSHRQPSRGRPGRPTSSLW